MLATAASLRLAENSPRTLVRSPCTRARRARSAPQRIDPPLHFTIQLVGFAADLEQLFLQAQQLAVHRHAWRAR